MTALTGDPHALGDPADVLAEIAGGAVGPVPSPPARPGPSTPRSPTETTAYELAMCRRDDVVPDNAVSGASPRRYRRCSWVGSPPDLQLLHSVMSSSQSCTSSGATVLSRQARQVGDKMLAAWDGVDLPLSAVVDNTSARTGTEAVFRTALSHLAFDMTGGAGRGIRDAGAPIPFGPALSARNVTYESPDHRQRSVGRRQALQCSRTLYATARMTESGITGSLGFDERHHDPERLARVADAFHAGIGALPAG
ncbi:hypothetical protein [Streptomyces sp. NPDC057052]|uniref:hypothetical protein n=1 Tax=Streptomyces sp. NPDC057052 TaxID=3346010 RepID=UPI00363AC6BB